MLHFVSCVSQHRSTLTLNKVIQRISIDDDFYYHHHFPMVIIINHMVNGHHYDDDDDDDDDDGRQGPGLGLSASPICPIKGLAARLSSPNPGSQR